MTIDPSPGVQQPVCGLNLQFNIQTDYEGGMSMLITTPVN